MEEQEEPEVEQGVDDADAGEAGQRQATRADPDPGGLTGQRAPSRGPRAAIAKE